MRGTRRSTAALLLALAFVAGGTAAASAAPGDIDQSYGVGGRAELVPDADYGGVAAVAPDGSVYGSVSPWHTPGTLIEGTSGAAVFTRVSPDGVPDMTFADHGVLRQPLVLPGGWKRTEGNEARPIADRAGRLVVLGEHLRVRGCCTEQFGVGVLRFLPDGQPDPSFGTDGVVMLGPDELGGSGLIGAGVAGDDRGRLLITGDVLPTADPRRGVVLRLTPEGQLDPTFGTDGLATLETAFTTEDAAVVSPDGHIGVAGLFDGDGENFGVAQLDDAGRPVDAFGDHGVATLAPWSYTPSLALRPDGGYVAVAETDPSGPVEPGTFLVASTPDGRPDRSFGADGRLYIGRDRAPDPGWAFTGALTVQPSGRILVTAMIVRYDVPGEDLEQLERYLPDGTPDRAFGTRGVLRPVEFRLGGVAYDASHSRLLVGEQPAAGTRKAHIVAVQDDDPPLPVVEATVGDGREPSGGAARTVPAPSVPATPPATAPTPPTTALLPATAGKAIIVGTRRLRMDRRHRVRVLLRCPAGTGGCAGVVALRLGRTTVARSTFHLPAGTTTKLRLTVRSSAVRRVTAANARTVAVLGGRTTRLRLVR